MLDDYTKLMKPIAHTKTKSYPAASAKQKLVDPFSLRLSSTREDWKLMKSPLFQFFKYNRIVVDEYTYVDGKNHTTVTKLQSNFKWVLSGTPPLEDFADVKTIATFLGIHVGVDDDTIGAIQLRNVKALRKDRTASEDFQSFKEYASFAWHQGRHKVAQRFLDQFVRQNIAEIDEIPFKDYLRGVKLPPVEYAIYLELDHHLKSQDMQIRKGRTKNENDREKRLKSSLNGSRSYEEALIKRCSHLELINDKSSDPCVSVVTERTSQYNSLVSDLQSSLMHAQWLKREIKNYDTHYSGWESNVNQNMFGDLEATVELQRLIENAIKGYSKSDKDLFYGMQPMNKREKGKPDKSSFSDRDEDENDNRAMHLQTLDDKYLALRNLAATLRRLSTELVSRTRSLRFFQAVRKVQIAALEDGTGQKSMYCDACGTEQVDVLNIYLLSSCGHTICVGCFKNQTGSEACLVKGCEAVAKAFHFIPAKDLGSENSKHIENTRLHYGQKLEEIVHLIKSLPDSDQVLLFMQYDDLMEKVEKALNDNKITNYCIMKSLKRTVSYMDAFQTEIGKTARKVLMLNLSDESASGANLTNANHVIFLSPLKADSQYFYDAAMTQAIGRARRFGQKKLVNIHRFFAIRTIETDIIQQRSGCKLVERTEGEFSLVPDETMNNRAGETLRYSDDDMTQQALIYDGEDMEGIEMGHS
jgi:hypothetical protein